MEKTAHILENLQNLLSEHLKVQMESKREMEKKYKRKLLASRIGLLCGAIIGLQGGLRKGVYTMVPFYIIMYAIITALAVLYFMDFKNVMKSCVKHCGQGFSEALEDGWISFFFKGYWIIQIFKITFGWLFVAFGILKDNVVELFSYKKHLANYNAIIEKDQKYLELLKNPIEDLDSISEQIQNHCGVVA